MKMSLEEFESWVIVRLEQVLNRPVTMEDLNQSFDGLGADSIDMVVLASELEELLAHEIEPEIFLRIDTIKGALDIIYEQATEVE